MSAHARPTHGLHKTESGRVSIRARVSGRSRRKRERGREQGRKTENDPHSHLVALAPAAVRTLPADEEVARLARRRAVLVRLAHERERLERELRRVREADAPRAEPRAFGLLHLVEVVDGLRDGSPVEERRYEVTICA